MNNAIAAIDPGTTKMVVLIGRKNQDGALELSGLGNVRYGGVQGNGWQSEDMIYNALEKALGQAQKMAGFRVSHCTLGIPNEYCGLIRNKKEITLDRPVTKQDVMELRRMVASYTLPAPWKVSNVLYDRFQVDSGNVNNPLGMDSERLALEASLICIENDFAKQLVRILSSLKVEVDRVIPVPLASGELFLSQEEKQKGAVWIDVGGQSTDYAVYKSGIPVLYDWIPVGGDNITQDIVTGTGVSAEEADRLKRYCVLGLASSRESDEESLDMPVRKGRSIQNIPLEFLQEIVEARIEELLEIVRNRIESEGLLDQCHTIVLAGGGISLLRGIREFGSRVMGIPVRLGVPDVIGLSSPALSAVYALGCSTLNEEVNRLTPLKVLRALIRKFKK